MLCVVLELFCHYVLHLHSPYSWPLTPAPEIQFDLIEYVPKFAQFHRDAFFATEVDAPFPYPAPMATLYWLLYLWPHNVRLLFGILAGIMITGPVALVFRRFTASGMTSSAAATFLGITLFCSYPFIFELKQGNLELFVWLIISLGIWLFLRDRGYASATCFAIACSMKLFPIIYLGLHIAQRKWRMAAYAIILAGLVSLGSLWLLDPHMRFAWHQLQTDMNQLQTRIVLQVVPREIGFDHSLFSLLKRALIGIVPLASVLRTYMVICAIAGTLLYFLRIRHLPLANQILILSVCSILLPPVSYDYTLIYLYAPLVLISLIVIRGGRPRGLTTILVLLAVALAPLSEFIWHASRFGGQLRAIVLLALLVSGLRSPLPPQRNPSANPQS